MERVIKPYLVIVGVAFAAVTSVRADVLLMSPRPTDTDGTRAYGASQFGHLPAPAVSSDPKGLDRSPAGVLPGSVESEPRSLNTDLIPDRSKGVQEVALIANDLGFFPKTFFVTRDIPVRLFVTGASKNTLCIMLDAFNVRKQVSFQKVAEITFMPANPGQYRYYCPVNGMEGTMVVRELASIERGDQ